MIHPRTSRSPVTMQPQESTIHVQSPIQVASAFMQRDQEAPSLGNIEANDRSAMPLVENRSSRSPAAANPVLSVSTLNEAVKIKRNAVFR